MTAFQFELFRNGGFENVERDVELLELVAQIFGGGASKLGFGSGGFRRWYV